MNDILSSINAIQGVIGSVVFSTNGQCLGSVLMPPYEPVLFSQFLVQLKASGDIFAQLSENPINIAILRFDAGYLYLRNLKSALLAVLTQANANLSMVSVGCNVAALKLEATISAPISSPSPQSNSPDRGTISNRFPSLAVQEPNAISDQYSPMPRVNETPNKLNMTPQTGALSTSSQSTKLSGTPALPGDIPPDAVGRPVVEALLKALARQMGPFAKVYIKEALARLGATADTVTISQYADLVSLVSTRVTDPIRMKAFLAEAATLLPKK